MNFVVQSFPGKLDSFLCILAVVVQRTISILILAGIIQITMKNVLLQVESDQKRFEACRRESVMKRVINIHHKT
jgi:hypothetical protein